MAKSKRKQRQQVINAMIGAIIVDNPVEYAERLIHPRIAVVRSLRDDPLGRLHDRKQIDEAQYKAGRTWQGLYERASIGKLLSPDPTKEPVDGGNKVPEPLTDAQIRAIKRIGELDRALGQDGAALVRDVLAERMFVAAILKKRGIAASSRATDYFARRFKECLETLAYEMGYS